MGTINHGGTEGTEYPTEAETHNSHNHKLYPNNNYAGLLTIPRDGFRAALRELRVSVVKTHH